MLKNWKTTLAGLVGMFGGAFKIIVENHQALTLGNALPLIGIGLIGLFAKDSNVTGGTVQQ